jgi:hypothetical protein
VEAREEVAGVAGAGRSFAALARQIGGGPAVGFGHVQGLVVVVLEMVLRLRMVVRVVVVLGLMVMMVVGMVLVSMVLQVPGHLS